MSHQALLPVDEGGLRAHREASDARRRIGARMFDFSREVAVMAIINRTPDSFFDQGATFAFDRALDAAITAVRDGADIVDVGGVPFGHGPAVSLDEEIARVVPLIEAIRAISEVAISVDTHSRRGCADKHRGRRDRRQRHERAAGSGNAGGSRRQRSHAGAYPQCRAAAQRAISCALC